MAGKSKIRMERSAMCDRIRTLRALERGRFSGHRQSKCLPAPTTNRPGAQMPARTVLPVEMGPPNVFPDTTHAHRIEVMAKIIELQAKLQLFIAVNTFTWKEGRNTAEVRGTEFEGQHHIFRFVRTHQIDTVAKHLTAAVPKLIMVSVGRFRQIASENKDKLVQMWVSGNVEDPRGSGQDSLTYMGCSRLIMGPGSVPHHCKKRVGVETMDLPTETCSPFHAHAGECCCMKDNIPCYGMTVMVTDGTGFCPAEVWRPVVHILGMKAYYWVSLTASQKQSAWIACHGPYVVLLASIPSQGKISHFQVLGIARARAPHNGIIAKHVSLNPSSLDFARVSIQSVDEEDEVELLTK